MGKPHGQYQKILQVLLQTVSTCEARMVPSLLCSQGEFL